MIDKFKKMSEVQSTVDVGEKDYLVGTLENGQTFKINAKDVALALMKFMPVATFLNNGLMEASSFMIRSVPNKDCDRATDSGYYRINGNELNKPSGNGFILSFRLDTELTYQVFVSFFSQKIYLRRFTEYLWTEWETL